MFAFATEIRDQLAAIEASGLTKHERLITTAQGPVIGVGAVSEAEPLSDLLALPTPPVEAPPASPVLNFCANNYLGLANHPQVIAAAAHGLHRWGFGMASVRFICGTEAQHRALETEIADFLQVDDAILFSSCFDANGAIFDILLTEADAIISDELNHASIIDGIRLCKARRLRYRNADMEDLRSQLTAAQEAGARRIMIVTDGVFSMDGSLAPLPEIVDLAEAFGALVMVDDSHATGFVGGGGRGTPEHFGVAHRIDLYSGTLGKALGGASGGYLAGHQLIIDLARQVARPYLFSNSLAPAVVTGSRVALALAAGDDAGRAQIKANAAQFRAGMAAAGFELLPGEHAIVAVMFPGADGARQATQIAAAMQEQGVYVTAFSYPVVPRGKARIRVQLSAAHSEADVAACIEAFIAARDTLA